MRQLDVLLIGEGSSDTSFLSRVVERSLEDLCLREVDSMVNIALASVKAGGSADEPRVQWIINRAREEQVTVVLLHRDGTADVAREIRNSVEPLRTAWPAETFALLGTVMPVREMESWALADLDVVETIIGRMIDRSSVFEGQLLGTPERLSDPKRTIQDVARLAVRPRRRRMPDVGGYLPALAENVPLEGLRLLSSFRHFEDGVITLLDDLGWRTP